MKVAKFGGSSLASPEQVKKVCDIIADDPDRKIIVVSAPGKRHKQDTKVTDLLIQCAETHINNESTDSLVEEITSRYHAISSAFQLPDDFLHTIRNDLQCRLSTNYENSAFFLDAMKAAGEDNNARLIAEILKMQGRHARYVNPKEGGMILSNEAGQARMLESSYEKLSHLKKYDGTIIFPGFFGFTEQGSLVTFPRGGSDITGAILAAAVEADIYENFTDVDSVLAANPDVVSNPEPIRVLTYQEMRELSYAGFGVFHDEALEPVVQLGIPVHVRNTNNPAAPGTAIVHKRTLDKDRPVVGIAAKDGFCSIYISKYLMNRAVGFGRRVLQVLEDAGIPYEHTPSGIDNMSIIVQEAYFPKEIESTIIEQLRRAVDADAVAVERDIALVMVVGEGMNHAIGLTGRAGGALGKAGVNIEMINQGSSEVSMMFGVKAPDMNRAVESLYEEFFPST